MIRPIQHLVKRIVCEQHGLPDAAVKDTDRITTNLGADSLDHVELVIAIEDEFGIEVTYEDAERFKDATIPEITEAIGLHLAAKAS